MKKILKQAFVIWLCVVAGCAYQGKNRSQAPGLPEEIIIASPGKAGLGRWHVCIFEFSEPRSAKGMGMAAAESLRLELLKNKAFANVVLHPNPNTDDPAALLEFARQKKYDLLITGDLTYYLEGGFSVPSRVDERIRVVVARTKTADTLWDARAWEVSRPVTTGDFIFVQRRPSPAVSAPSLLKINAGKFCNMMMLSRNPGTQKSVAPLY